MILKKVCCLFWLTLLVGGFNLSAADGDERRWKKEGIPHRGWTHQDVEDLGVAEGECEMCDKTHIRYMHTVSHEEHGNLLVGCVCAEKMTEDYVNPKAREKVAKNEAAKRRQAERRLQERQQRRQQEQIERRQQRQQAWLNLAGWIAKENGNYSNKLGGEWVTIFYKFGAWKYIYNNEFSQGFASADLARAAFVAQYQERIAADN